MTGIKIHKSKVSPIPTALPPQYHQTKKPSARKVSRNSNNVESTYESYINTNYPDNGAPSVEVALPEVTLPTRQPRVSGVRLAIIALCATITAFFISPLSPVKSLAGYDILAAAALPIVGTIAVIWGARRLR